MNSVDLHFWDFQVRFMMMITVMPIMLYTQAIVTRHMPALQAYCLCPEACQAFMSTAVRTHFATYEPWLESLLQLSLSSSTLVAVQGSHPAHVELCGIKTLCFFNIALGVITLLHLVNNGEASMGVTDRNSHYRCDPALYKSCLKLNGKC